MAEEKEIKKKTKRPTAIKRDLQNEKRRLENKSFKSKVRTTLRTFEEAYESKNQANAKEALSAVFSIMDKGVKKGVYKPNTVNRLKTRAFAKIKALSA